MTWFGKLKQAPTPTLMPALIAPENVPETLQSFPKDFERYQYAGVAIEKISPDGMAPRCPSLVARMIYHQRSVDGAASAQIDMTCSLKDLRNFKAQNAAEHPQTQIAAEKLGAYYLTKVYGARQITESRTAASPGRRMSLKVVAAAADTDRTAKTVALPINAPQPSGGAAAVKIVPNNNFYGAMNAAF